jgi:uncharacterized protein (DUF488 family)
MEHGTDLDGVRVTESNKRAQKVIFTIGYSNRTLADLMGLLREAGVQIVADVRSSPNSRQSPDFNQKHLAERLPKLGITYHHLKDLGGQGREALERSPNLGLSKTWQGYADYMLSDEFERSFRRLQALVTIGPVALLCAEADWSRCHRRLLADVLTVRGHQVRHLDESGQPVPHALTPRLEVRDGKVYYPATGEQLKLF